VCYRVRCDSPTSDTLVEIDGTDQFGTGALLVKQRQGSRRLCVPVPKATGTPAPAPTQTPLATETPLPTETPAASGTPDPTATQTPEPCPTPVACPEACRSAIAEFDAAMAMPCQSCFVSDSVTCGYDSNRMAGAVDWSRDESNGGDARSILHVAAGQCVVSIRDVPVHSSSISDAEQAACAPIADAVVEEHTTETCDTSPQ
jgi:hypothetical protein